MKDFLGHAWGHGPSGPRPISAPGVGPVFVLLSRIQPVVDFFRRLCDCLRHPQRRPARPVRAPWNKQRAAAEE
ncbi:hypothetical protein HU200_055344 [Digitaria exilis]|uniref:Uncharacterized protein n=1 Tax=Digitaria exilis TaxID=1010633 RepID=A0A835ATF6_9POAL|nr:hypothetical protein HU200_055344 [Digitaria exilis]